MVRLRFSGKTWILCAMMMGSSGAAHAGDCAPIVDAFNQAVESGQEAQAQQLVDRIATDAQCSRFQVPAQRRLAAFRLAGAQLLMARGRPVADYERLLSEATRPEVLWQAAATMGEVRFGERRFTEAATAFDQAIEIVKNETVTPNAPSKFEIEGLFDRAAQARLLAANPEPGKEGDGFVKTARDQRDGKLGGFYSPNVRGVVPHAIPIPVTFEYAKTTFTAVGEAAARELVVALQEQQPARIVLVGHTDVRGSAENNMKLSLARAQAVAAFLRDNHIDIPVETVGKGSTEPIHLVDSAGLSEEDIYALNRRVELKRE
jgi:outer membrane protein OmpA-like peptidoglycan-associated protein